MTRVLTITPSSTPINQQQILNYSGIWTSVNVESFTWAQIWSYSYICLKVVSSSTSSSAFKVGCKTTIFTFSSEVKMVQLVKLQILENMIVSCEFCKNNIKSLRSNLKISHWQGYEYLFVFLSIKNHPKSVIPVRYCHRCLCFNLSYIAIVYWV